jgi:hypothetical protein
MFRRTSGDHGASRIARRSSPSGTPGETAETGQAIETMTEILPRHFCMKFCGFHCTLLAQRLEERAGHAC